MLDFSRDKPYDLDLGVLLEGRFGDPEHGIAPGTAWADVPMNWTCPECGARKEDFEMVQV